MPNLHGITFLRSIVTDLHKLSCLIYNQYDALFTLNIMPYWHLIPYLTINISCFIFIEYHA